MQKSNLFLEAVSKLFLWRSSSSVHVVDVCLRRSNLNLLLSVVEGVCWVGFTIRKNTGAPKDGDTSAYMIRALSDAIDAGYPCRDSLVQTLLRVGGTRCFRTCFYVASASSCSSSCT